ncbi:rRNA maturation RNase YbeY [Marinicella litoralis]|uniref:Endoribonuclease YbeY n=1 Tax=Marinicella litoralis TaxID=644220 RepID=A0A4R6XGB9_9GAMM|nr:rRNA maturation RNase YbeY [Marinicella litoralis]TDR16784.1 putative rRNA maturation factor [Marinicella litoralis]
MISLELINENNLAAPDSAQFQIWLNQVAEKLNITGEICIKIVDETESHDLNHSYRGIAKPTNVLSFPAEIPDFVESTHLGDLAICAPVVIRESVDQNKPAVNHWAHMSIHGTLHLLGYDHIEDVDAEEMETLEIELLKALGMVDPYH